MTKTKCPGSGQLPVHIADPQCPYPFCPVCGREFSAQGRKAARKPNPWLVGCPSHYRQKL